jgi:hypothetical protein
MQANLALRSCQADSPCGYKNRKNHLVFTSNAAISLPGRGMQLPRRLIEVTYEMAAGIRAHHGFASLAHRVGGSANTNPMRERGGSK